MPNDDMRNIIKQVSFPTFYVVVKMQMGLS